ncbi:hypothetical protein KUG85_12925 [Nitratireductor sp. L1-7-SE]|uniref:Cbb3-type cytochrome c oxidase subunit I n=2 Tax=Nitratireductor rhodophyticola TaxID=2854036 RepID=A0ABS7R5N5_9HYPH|nr:hypothetical protein [Nitratireductor rhodophyticola]MBY8921604.1 hypothetical protein [Nitratireductor rhodophyticola]MEC9244174.1 hypothetical protein [Pseudomonadota bacterium]
MNGLARVCWITAPLYAVLGMSFGIYMAASGDHTLAPAHGHLNLLGWVTIGLYGAFYTLVPQAAEGRLARLQVLLAQLGVIVTAPGIAFAILGMGEGLAKAGAVLILLGALLFLIIVVRATGRSAAGA